MPFENSPKSNFVYNDLLRERTSLNKAIEMRSIVGIGSTIVEAYNIMAASLDKIFINSLVAINEKKQQIANLTAEIYDNRANKPFGCGIVSTAIDTSYFNDPNNEKYLKAVHVGSAVTFTYDGGLVGARARIRKDTLFAFTYPALENNDTSQTFPVLPGSEEYVVVTNSNVGIGRTSIYASDRGDTSGQYSEADSYGFFYAIEASPNPSGQCLNRLNQIETLTNEIEALRDGLGDYTSEANVIKERKHREQLKYWYELKAMNDLDIKVADVEGVIQTIEQNEVTIAAYEDSVS
jgi:hypothetical protein